MGPRANGGAESCTAGLWEHTGISAVQNSWVFHKKGHKRREDEFLSDDTTFTV